MKELRFEEAGGVWRVAFAFDTNWAAVLLTAHPEATCGEVADQRAL
ncbi:MAG: type II toxin-antitoxin system RelE/ParE family toxin [Burkholderiales bacterium]